jgi:CMP-N-acetylneuraminic acid synthetase
MLSGKSVVAVIPARGGSERVPRKNIADLAGKPLLVHTVEFARELPEVDAIVVSSEDDEILRVAQASGAEPLRRPMDLALPHVKDEPVLLHALERLEASGRYFDYVVMLQVTSPMRNAQTVREVIARGILGGFDVVATVVENRDYFRRLIDGKWEPLVSDAPRRQQERQPMYAETGVCYIMNVSRLKATGKIFAGSKEDFVIVGPIESVDINTPMDLEFVRFLKLKGY